MDNTFVEENVSYDNLNSAIPKKKIILFSVLAAGVPCIIQNLLTPLIYEIISENINISSSAMAGVGTLIGFLAAAVRLVLLIWGGYNITRSKDGTVRFVGIFMFSVTIASSVMSLFDFVERIPLAAEAIAYIMLALNILADILGAVINIKLFSIFEYRTENRYVTGAEASLFRKRMLILLVLIYAISFVSSGIVPYFTAALGTTMEDIQIILYVISIGGFLLGILTLYLIYRLSLSVRNEKADAIGLGSAYYIGGVFTAPVTFLVTGLLQGLIASEISNSIAIIQGFITLGFSLITGIASVVIMFKTLKIFFPVREKPTYEPEDRAERIFRNLIELKKNTEIEN